MDVVIVASVFFILGMPRTLLYIPIFIFLWYASGASAGPSDDLSRFAASMINISFVIICAWGVLTNIKKYVLKIK